MNIFAVGINHKTAPIDIREDFFLRHTEQDLLLSEFRNDPGVIEAFVVSTCNRTEVYLHLLDKIPPTGFVIRRLAQIKKLKNPGRYVKYFYAYSGEEAVGHLLRVSSGLDSLVLGEKQILGQLKSAFKRATEKLMFQKYFNVLSNTAIRAGKKAQAETDIGYGGSSVSWAAITMIEKMLGSFKDRSVLILGAGKMSEIALTQMKNKGISRMFLMNRTELIAQELAAKFGGEAVPFCDIKEMLSLADVCICSTGAPHYVLEKSTVEKAAAANPGKNFLFMDISMPRNIDPRAAQIRNVRIFTIDDLDKVVEKNMRKRQLAVVQVERIIAKKQDAFFRKIARLQDEQKFKEKPLPVS